jgi:hypothetical protein
MLTEIHPFFTIASCLGCQYSRFRSITPTRALTEVNPGEELFAIISKHICLTIQMHAIPYLFTVIQRSCAQKTTCHNASILVNCRHYNSWSRLYYWCSLLLWGKLHVEAAEYS